MVVGVLPLVEFREGLGERRGELVRLKHECRNDLQFDGGDDAERPRPTRADSNSSGSVSASTLVTDPSARTSSSAVIPLASEANLRPVPWVPVAVRAGQRLHPDVAHVGQCQPEVVRAWHRSVRVVPARTCTWLSSTRLTPVSRSGRSRTPFVAAVAVNECPAPTIRMSTPGGGLAISAETSCAESGVATLTGRPSAVRAQLRHVVMNAPVRLRAALLW